jgi:hypothetical protein
MCVSSISDAGAWFASRTDGAARTLALIGVALLGAILVASIVLAEPINSQFRPRPEGVGHAESCQPARSPLSGVDHHHASGRRRNS